MHYPDYSIEDRLITEGYRYVVGVDEVGRGPGAGPVVASAVYVPPEVMPDLYLRVRDSKKLSEHKREVLYDEITSKCSYGIGIIDNKKIDEINILQATIMAMTIAINKLPNVDYIIVDGTVRLDKLGLPYYPIVGGDNLSISIASASIVAKVTRDEIMRTLHWVYPQYSWMHNKGYLTSEHIEAIKTYGPTEYHRLSFKKVGD
jgi:ribonuclease HII